MPLRPTNSVSDLPVHGLMLTATFLVATSFPVAAAITGGLDSVVLTLIRFSLATLLFAPIVLWRYGLVVPKASDFLRYGVLSILLVTFFWCMFTALRMTSPLNTAAIFALNPIITATLAAVLLRERMPLSARVALPIGAVGAIWVIFRGDPKAFLALEFGTGDIVFLAGTIALAAYGTLVKVLHRGEPMARMTFWILATGSVWLLLLSLPKLGDIQWSAIPFGVFAGIAYLSIFTTIVTFFSPPVEYDPDRANPGCSLHVPEPGAGPCHRTGVRGYAATLGDMARRDAGDRGDSRFTVKPEGWKTQAAVKTLPDTSILNRKRHLNRCTEGPADLRAGEGGHMPPFNRCLLVAQIREPA